MASRSDLPLLGPFPSSFSSALAALAGGGVGTGPGALFVLSRAPPSISFAGSWPWEVCRRRCTVVASSSAWSGGGGRGEQDHYAVLGLPRNASAADIKRAFRLLAKKYHPDVSNDLRTVEVFKSIKYAYEVLSNEVSRAKYDMLLTFPRATTNTWRKERATNSRYNRRKKARKWVDDPQIWYEEQQAYSWYAQRDSFEEYASYERGPLVEVLRFALFTLFLMKIAGYRASLTLYSLTALFDRQLDNGYKMGYVFAWYMGGQGGILLALFLNFSSWLFGKSSSSLVALVVSALWVAGKIAAFVPLPHGAVLTLLYLSIRFQVESK